LEPKQQQHDGGSGGCPTAFEKGLRAPPWRAATPARTSAAPFWRLRRHDRPAVVGDFDVGKVHFVAVVAFHRVLAACSTA
jgi:hypothetical protein